MQINVWQGFAKRSNSTKQPTTGTQKTVLLKEVVDVKSPSFIIESADNNYNYVEAFGNYYYCDCERLDSSRVKLNCHMDYPATFKAGIGSYRGLIDFTSSSSELMITDPRNAPTGNVANSHQGASLDFSTDTTGCYIVGVAAKDGIKNGTTTWYAMSKAALLSVCQSIYDSTLWQQMWNQFNGVQNAILSAFWVPFSQSYVATYF